MSNDRLENTQVPFRYLNESGENLFNSAHLVAPIRCVRVSQYSAVHPAFVTESFLHSRIDRQKNQLNKGLSIKFLWAIGAFQGPLQFCAPRFEELKEAFLEDSCWANIKSSIEDRQNGLDPGGQPRG